MYFHARLPSEANKRFSVINMYVLHLSHMSQLSNYSALTPGFPHPKSSSFLDAMGCSRTVR